MDPHENMETIRLLNRMGRRPIYWRKHIKALTMRLAHLQSKADAGRYSKTSMAYMMAEINALKWAVDLLEKIKPHTSTSA